MTIDPKNIDSREFYTYATSVIAPRPIAFASTIDSHGKVNLSPFSFFNLVGINPALLVFSPNRRGRDGSQKNTTENLHEVPEVVINLVDYSMVQQMSLSSCEYPKGVNEFEKAGFTEEKSLLIQPPRVKESTVQFECKVLEIKEYGTANIVICEIIMAHFAEKLLDEKGKIDQLKTDWVARLGGDWYARISPDTLFKVPKPSTNQGIGIDQLPDFIKFSNQLSGNDLGKLGNLESLPTEAEIKIFKENNDFSQVDKFQKAKSLLDKNLVREAICVLMSLE